MDRKIFVLLFLILLSSLDVLHGQIPGSDDLFSHYRNLSKQSMTEGNYQQALDYLNCQVQYYPSNYGCGLGYIYDNREYVELASISHYNLSNYDTVKSVLLPLSFSNVYNIYTPSNGDAVDLDSILYKTLRVEYSDSEILAELNNCITNALTERKPFSVDGEYFIYEMFGERIKSSDPVRRYKSYKREWLDDKELSQEDTDKLYDHIYDLAITESIINMRLYKFIDSAP